ncbi:hypothetical protein NEIMUCOT_04470 [Neisseria mucosa ATCC 25996]|uniref:Uncharacterized protein n=1 Tax=Neisseria mucosa (strain ATCC 25996 / DSM 4631 / NCTC 10774 / M26) TaxID=546266 RepID=D2ZV29_NEIM2|nr:hypothetical protein NEIMUCOT_04470 [Neisseria mucosa ATCC 25996]
MNLFDLKIYVCFVGRIPESDQSTLVLVFRRPHAIKQVVQP